MKMNIIKKINLKTYLTFKKRNQRKNEKDRKIKFKNKKNQNSLKKSFFQKYNYYHSKRR